VNKIPPKFDTLFVTSLISRSAIYRAHCVMPLEVAWDVFRSRLALKG